MGVSEPPRRSSVSRIPFDPAELARGLAALLVVRASVVTVLLAATVAVQTGYAELEAPTTRFLLGVAGATYLLTGLYALLHSRLKGREWFALLQITLDTVGCTALVYATGGAASGFTFLYGLEVVVGAVLLGRRGAAYAALVSWLLLAGLTTAMVGEWLPPLPDQGVAIVRLPPEEVAYQLFVNAVMLLLVAVLSGWLAERLRRAGGELRVAEARTARALRREEDIVRSITSGLLTTDLGGVVQTVNPAGAQILGYVASEVRGRPLGEVLPAANVALDRGTRGEAQHVRPTGEPVPIGFTTSRLNDADGNGEGHIVIFQDMTQLRAMRRAVEESERLAAVGRVAAGLAHEIRNPLGSISGSVELLRETAALGPEDRSLLDLVLVETERLNSLVTDILLFSRPRPPQPQVVDLAALVRDVATMFRRGTTARGAAVEVEVPSQLEGAMDPAQIRQVLWNLLKNAAQASADGAPIRLCAEATPSGVRIEVIDRGKGIAPEQRDKLFEPFETGRDQGIGIGLALVKQIVLAHHGTVEVESMPGEGATFRVELPNAAT